MSDDGFHEIQLNGKQLVFLFMAATVVSVVIFLCGVMVGRGVRSDRAEPGSQQTDLATPAGATAAAPASAPVPVPPAARGSVTPPEPAEDGSTMKALTAEKPPDTSLESKAPAKHAAAAAKSAPAEKPAEPHTQSAKPADTAAASQATPPPVAAPAPPTAVTSGGFAVQITALRDRSEADAIVRRLEAKGYPAYVVNPLPGKPPVYRVQVGRFQDRAEADRIASRLQKEEQFSPWVTR
jgi:cell division septation protein DedD